MFRQAPAPERADPRYGGYGPNCVFCKSAVAASDMTCPRCKARKGTRGDDGDGLARRILAWNLTVGPASYVAFRCAKGVWEEAGTRSLLSNGINLVCAVLGVLIAYLVHRLFVERLGTVWDRGWVAP